MEIFKIRKRPKRDPLRWIRRGENLEGDPQGYTSISGVTNRPLKELLENDLDLLRNLELVVSLVEEIQKSGIDQPRHLDLPGSWLTHLDIDLNPTKKTYISSSERHHDHTDQVTGTHGDHSDHMDIEAMSSIVHGDILHEDHNDYIPHSDYTDHANSYSDHSDFLSKPHGDILHLDYNDHANTTTRSPGYSDHSDYHSDHSDHGDLTTNVAYGDHTDHYDCIKTVKILMPQALGWVSPIRCYPDGTLHHDHNDHQDYPASYTHYTDGHSPIFRSFGYNPVSHYDGYVHEDGHTEWFYADYSVHGDYPPDQELHLDTYKYAYSDHTDQPHEDIHHDSNIHQDIHGDHNDTYSTTVYIDHNDHQDQAHLDHPHLDHNDHVNTHYDTQLYHFDTESKTLHQDINHEDHEDHGDRPHGDSGVGHIDRAGTASTYHLDYTPESGIYHYDNGKEHYDLTLFPGAHKDYGISRDSDVEQGMYEEVYPGEWHGDRVWHQDEDIHGDTVQGQPVHQDHNDIQTHYDLPHGDMGHQDGLLYGHLDRPPESVQNHTDHLDGVAPYVFHGDQIQVIESGPHLDHLDWIHQDFAHLDREHQDSSGHLDESTIAQEHIDYSHSDHADHSDWEHGDHLDIDLAIGKFTHFVSYTDHGDLTEHQDLPHADGVLHLDYSPNHTDHFDHVDIPHGDMEEEFLHEDFYTPPNHLDVGTPHEDTSYYHNDSFTGGHIDYHADHSDHGDFSSGERHGDFTYSTPHSDRAHGDSTLEEYHYDGPEGPAHQDLYAHKDTAHLDEVRHTDRTSI